MLPSLARGGQGIARAAQRAAGVAHPVRRAPISGARRNMGGHTRYIGLPGEHVPIEVSKWHKNLGTAYLTTMFLWMMYRAKEDGLVLLGLEHPWDHMDDHDDHDDEEVDEVTAATDDDEDEGGDEEEEDKEEEAEDDEE